MTHPTRRRLELELEPAELGRLLEQLDAGGGRGASRPSIRPLVIRSEHLPKLDGHAPDQHPG